MKMALALHKESFFWHRVHSLTGIVPVGFYMVQHLSLNSFSLAGPERYNGVGNFFYSLPIGLLLLIEIGMVWVPLVFHAVYGMFIVNRGEPNVMGTPYGWSQNRMYWFQRLTGMFLFAFLIYHVISTTGHVKIANDHHVVDYAGMRGKLLEFGGLALGLYVLGVLTASYHFAYGLWNICVRWGITVGEAAQLRVQKASFAIFLGLTLLGWSALAGFFLYKVEPKSESRQITAMAPRP